MLHRQLRSVTASDAQRRSGHGQPLSERPSTPSHARAPAVDRLRPTQERLRYTRKRRRPLERLRRRSTPYRPSSARDMMTVCNAIYPIANLFNMHVACSQPVAYKCAEQRTSTAGGGLPGSRSRSVAKLRARLSWDRPARGEQPASRNQLRPTLAEQNRLSSGASGARAAPASAASG